MKNMKNLVQESFPVVLGLGALVAVTFILGRVYFLI